MFQPSRILLIKPSSFGDIVNSLPVLAACKAQWPDAQIDWAVKREWAELLAGHSMLRRLVFFPSTFSAGVGSWRSLHRDDYDMVFDLQGLLRSALYAALTGCPVRIGFHDSREGSGWFYSHRIEVPRNVVHAVDRGLELVRRIGVSASATPSFPIADGSKERQWVDALWRRHHMGDGEAVCVIHPSARWETKRWPAARFAQLADVLAGKEGIRVIIIGSASEASRTDEMTRHMAQTAVDLTGKTDLLQLAALLRRSDLLVTNDSGPMHLAAALGTPVVAIFGPTDPARVGPYGAGHIVLRKEVDCSGCSRGSCVRDALCLKAVGVDEVLASVRTILSRAPQPAASAGIGIRS